MSDFKFGSISKMVLHYVGNKSKGEGLSYSDIQDKVDTIQDDIINLFERNFKFDSLYHFFFPKNINLNPVYNFVTNAFENKESFYESSKDIARFLYDCSMHQHIKSGELCCFYFDNCIYKTKNVECLVLFKSEEKNKILKIDSSSSGMSIDSFIGIGLEKIQKGCLIIKQEKELGYIVSLVNDLNSKNVKYWNDDFLKIKRINNEYECTSNFLEFTKRSIEDYSFESVSTKVEILNNTFSYIKERDIVNKKYFYNEVLKEESLINCFEKNEKKFFDEKLLEFNVSQAALKNKKKKFKNIIKLDNNISIHIKENNSNIENGNENGKKFYKIFYEYEE